MKIYRYWAKAAADQQPTDKFVECYGCSGESLEAALANARERANQIAARMKQGQPPGQYTYAERPVREEIVDEFAHADEQAAVITRNSYGSLILNTPRVLFADIDFKPPALSLSSLLGALFGKKKPSQEEQIIHRIEQVVAAQPALGLRVYRTNNGFRCLAKSRTYDPLSEESNLLLKELDADPMYKQLCRVQECYRARISPKPWRCGVDKPPARFPFLDPGVEQQYRAWQSEYERQAQSFSTCALIADFGSAQVHPEAEAVMKLHDHFTCQGDGPLA